MKFVLYCRHKKCDAEISVEADNAAEAKQMADEAFTKHNHEVHRR